MNREAQTNRNLTEERTKCLIRAMTTTRQSAARMSRHSGCGTGLCCARTRNRRKEGPSCGCPVWTALRWPCDRPPDHAAQPTTARLTTARPTRTGRAGPGSPPRSTAPAGTARPSRRSCRR
jgi:hypothetical protein